MTGQPSALQQRRYSGAGQKQAFTVMLIVLLCAVTFAPLFDNPFVADDYVFMERVDRFATDPLFLYDEAPLNYRMTTFLVFLLLKTLVGYTPVVFYTFTILVHVINCLLLWRLLVLLGRDQTESVSAAVVFAVFHGPQEAVMWLVAMGESLLGLCALVVMIAWIEKRYALAFSIYLVALFTKESAPLIWVLVLLLIWYRGERISSRPVAILTLMTAIFGVFFFWMWSTNSFIQEGAYDFGASAPRVLGLSMFRLLWPWFYIALVLSLLRQRTVAPLRPIPAVIGLLALTMSPYIFLTYAKALPSRHVYLASIVFAAAVAAFLRQASPSLRYVFLTVFVGFNIGLVWLRKDVQFEIRAAPTHALIMELRKFDPQPILIRGFAYPFPEIAETAVLELPGWMRKFVIVEGEGYCEGCLTLTWDPQLQVYHVSNLP